MGHVTDTIKCMMQVINNEKRWSNISSSGENIVTSVVGKIIMID